MYRKRSSTTAEDIETSDETAVVCIACGQTDHTFTTKAQFGRKMLRCNACGLVFAVPLWTDEVAAKVLAQAGQWPGGVTGETASYREDGLRFIARQIASRAPAGGRLLDVGCANGAFFDIMRSEVNSWRFYGAEPDPKWQGSASREAQVLPQPLRRCSFPDAFFDVVTTLGTLYLIPEPDRELAEIARVLKPSGLFVFDTPGQLYLRLRGLAGSMLGLERTRSFDAFPFYFSNRSLKNLLQGAGLRVVEVLANRGVVQPERPVRLLMSAYMGLAKGVIKISRGFLPICPELVYIARHKEMVETDKHGKSKECGS